jgi:hypothetical protein
MGASALPATIKLIYIMVGAGLLMLDAKSLRRVAVPFANLAFSL